jgi:hypothetical protein
MRKTLIRMIYVFFLLIAVPMGGISLFQNPAARDPWEERIAALLFDGRKKEAADYLRGFLTSQPDRLQYGIFGCLA